MSGQLQHYIPRINLLSDEKQFYFMSKCLLPKLSSICVQDQIGYVYLSVNLLRHRNGSTWTCEGKFVYPSMFTFHFYFLDICVRYYSAPNCVQHMYVKPKSNNVKAKW